MEPKMKSGQSRKVEPEEAIDALVERAVDSSARMARSEALERDYYPVGRKAGTKAERVERDIDSISNLSRQEAKRRDRGR